MRFQTAVNHPLKLSHSCHFSSQWYGISRFLLFLCHLVTITYLYIYIYIEVSWNGGTPKSLFFFYTWNINNPAIFRGVPQRPNGEKTSGNAAPQKTPGTAQVSRASFLEGLRRLRYDQLLRWRRSTKSNGEIVGVYGRFMVMITHVITSSNYMIIICYINGLCDYYILL